MRKRSIWLILEASSAWVRSGARFEGHTCPSYGRKAPIAGQKLLLLLGLLGVATCSRRRLLLTLTLEGSGSRLLLNLLVPLLSLLQAKLLLVLLHQSILVGILLQQALLLSAETVLVLLQILKHLELLLVKVEVRHLAGPYHLAIFLFETLLDCRRVISLKLGRLITIMASRV